MGRASLDYSVTLLPWDVGRATAGGKFLAGLSV